MDKDIEFKGAKDKKATMTEIREWYEKHWSGLSEKLDIQDAQDVCDIIWVWEKHRWKKTN